MRLRGCTALESERRGRKRGRALSRPWLSRARARRVAQSMNSFNA
ncbi:hypothetical protein [Lysobacter gummosus]